MTVPGITARYGWALESLAGIFRSSHLAGARPCCRRSRSLAMQRL